MTARLFVLRHDQPVGGLRHIVENALALARDLYRSGLDVAISVAPWESQRSKEQNALMWSLLTDLSKQKQWPVDGRLVFMEPEEWKDVMTAGLAKHQKVAAGIDGGFVLLGRRTSRMTVRQMGELIELIQAFGAEHGVRFREAPVAQLKEAA